MLWVLLHGPLGLRHRPILGGYEPIVQGKEIHPTRPIKTRVI